MPAKPQSNNKQLTWAKDNLLPGDFIYIVSELNLIGMQAARMGLKCNCERVLIIEGYKTENPRPIKAVKVTIK